MAIDDPKGAFERKYMQEEEKSPLGLTVFVGKLAFPNAALPLEIFRKVADRFTRASTEERLKALWHMLVMETEHLETTKANAEDRAKNVPLLQETSLQAACFGYGSRSQASSPSLLRSRNMT
jgi:hypothetical protein